MFKLGEIKGVIFDLDVNFIDTIDTFTRAFNKAIDKFGLKPTSRDKVADFMNNGIPMENILTELFPGTFQRDDDIHRFREDMKRLTWSWKRMA